MIGAMEDRAGHSVARLVSQPSKEQATHRAASEKCIEDLAVVRRYIRGAIARACPRWSEDDVEEVAQRAVVRLFEIKEKGHQNGGFTRAYLSTVVHSHIVDEFRRRSSLVPLDDHLGASGELSTNEQDPEEDCRLHELQTAIWACMRSLNQNRQRALALVLMGYKNREIAGLTGWDPKQSENHVTRARTDLRLCLRRKGFGVDGR